MRDANLALVLLDAAHLDLLLLEQLADLLYLCVIRRNDTNMLRFCFEKLYSENNLVKLRLHSLRRSLRSSRSELTYRLTSEASAMLKNEGEDASRSSLPATP